MTHTSWIIETIDLPIILTIGFNVKRHSFSQAYDEYISRRNHSTTTNEVSKNCGYTGCYEKSVRKSYIIMSNICLFSMCLTQNKEL
jgi:hypothetical protein